MTKANRRLAFLLSLLAAVILAGCSLAALADAKADSLWPLLIGLSISAGNAYRLRPQSSR